MPHETTGIEHVEVAFPHGGNPLKIRVTELETLHSDTTRASNVLAEGAFIVSRDIIDRDTRLLEEYPDCHGEVVLSEWSVSAIWLCMVHLHSMNPDPDLSALGWNPQHVWFVVAFWKAHVHDGTYNVDRMRRWFREWYEEYIIRGEKLFATQESAEDFNWLIFPALHVGDAKTFMKITRAWVMHHVTGGSSDKDKETIDIGNEEYILA